MGSLQDRMKLRGMRTWLRKGRERDRGTKSCRTRSSELHHEVTTSKQRLTNPRLTPNVERVWRKMKRLATLSVHARNQCERNLREDMITWRLGNPLEFVGKVRV